MEEIFFFIFALSQQTIMAKNIITRKIEVRLTAPSNEKKTEGYRLMRDWSNRSWRMANELVNELYLNDNILESAALRTDRFHQPLMDNRIAIKLAKNKIDRKKVIDDKKYLLKEAASELKLFVGSGLSPQNVGYRMVGLMNKDIPSSIRACLSDQTKSNFSNDRSNVLRGERSIRSYKSGMPVPFSKKDIKFSFSNEKGEYEFQFLSKFLPDCSFVTRLGRDRSNNASIIESIIKGEYKLCDSSFKFDGTKLFFYLVVDMPIQIKDVDLAKVLGADVGVKCMIRYSDPKGVLKGSIGGDGEVQRTRRRMFAQRRELQAGLIHARGGRGRKHKLAPLDRLEKKEKNFASTFNHVYSKQLIDVCVKNRIGTINMEDLTGLNGKMTDKMLRRWSYFDLQTKIEQKAKNVGIVVNWLNPRYTSQTCYKCGHCHEDNRKKRDTFACTNENCAIFAKKIDADLNAAINLANGMGMNEVVKEELEAAI